MDHILILGSIPKTEEEDIYNKVSKTLDLNVGALQTFTIPYSTWQERANKKLFNGK
ncbi:MAG: hypothetical protein U9R34_01490 [Nanoarchaeota archaeon]|nr:hypothetical protein [Nanoarchaeota archaeon]